MTQLKRWWSKKYDLPPNHKLFLERTSADLTQEMYEDMLTNRDELRAQLKEQGDQKVRKSILDAISAINAVFDEAPEVEDALVDEWERELADGKIPDLDREVDG